MDKRGSYTGQLYRGEPQTKSWSLIVSGHVTIRLLEVEGVAGEWRLAAFKKDKVWECRLDPRLKFRVKNDFVQWQTKGGGGETVTYGIRLKDPELASQLSEKIEEVLNAMMSKPPEADEVQLRVLFSSSEPTLLTVCNSTTMIQVLRMFCQKKQLDASQFMIALPHDSSPPMLKPSTTVGSLGTKEVQVVKKTSKPPSSSSHGPAAPSTQTETTNSNSGLAIAANEQILQVELPRDERTVVKVSPQTTISNLLRYICEKRNLELADHRFDLPATEESLAGKTLEQLKITSIRVVLRDGAKKKPEENGLELECKSPSRTKRQSTKKRNKIDNESDSPKGNRRQAPPPPPPLQNRRTQPNLIRELAVAAERKATLRSMERNSDPGCTPPVTKQTRSISDTTIPGGVESEGSADGSPDQQRKGKVPLLPNMSRINLQPRSYPAPSPPVPGSKATPTSETLHVHETSTAKATPITDSDAPHRTAAPPPIAVKPKKKIQTSSEDIGEPDSPPQAPPTKLEAAVPMAVDMDALMEEAVALEPTTKKVRKKVKKKESSEDSTAGDKKEKKTKSGKSTKKKKKVTQQEKGETPREDSVEREDISPLQHPPQGSPNLPPPPVPPEEEEPSPQVDRQTELQQVPPTMETKTLTPDLKRQVASLKRRPRGPAPPPPPPGPKTMTIGRIRQISDVNVKGRGFTTSATEGDSGRLVSDETATKPRSVSEALPHVEKVEVRSTASPTPPPRHRPTRKAPNRPAPSTPQGKEKTRMGDSKTQVETIASKETETKRGSLHGSPRRPPPTVPSSAPPAVPPAQVESAVVSNGNISESDILKQEKEDQPKVLGEDEGEGVVDVLQSKTDTSREDAGEEKSLQQTFTSSKPPSTPPKPKAQPQKRSPGQSPSGRRRDAATVICKDTEDGGKELIIKPSPHSKRKLSGPLVFKMPPPPSSPPNKSKPKKPSTLAKSEGVVLKKKDVGASAAAAVERVADNKMDTESADSSLGESSSDTPNKFDSSAKDSPQKPLSDTLVSNEFTNLDELLGDSNQEIVTTDFSIEENLEPIDECNGLEWNESGLPNADSRIPYQDPELELVTDIYHYGYDDSENAAAALNFNSNNNNNNNGLGADDDVIDYRDLPPPILPPEGGDSDEWERDSNRTGELNFDTSSSSAAELSRTSLGDEVVALEEEARPGGVVLVNIKHVKDDAPVFPEELAVKQDDQEGWTSQTGTTCGKEEKLMPGLIPRDPSIGAQLNELDDVVSSLAELAAEVPVLPPLPPPPPPSQPHPVTTSTPTHTKENRTTSPEPPPIPLSLPPPLTPSDEDDDDDEFPLGPPPPLATSEPPSLTPSPPSSPATDSKSERQEDEDFAENELLKRLKQRPLKSSSAWRRRRGSKDQETQEAAEDRENELLEKLKLRQLKYRQKPRERHKDSDTSPSSSTEQVSKPIPTRQGDVGSNSIPPQQPRMGTGSGTGTTGGDNVQLQLQFLQQQVLQQQMLQLQQQFQQLSSYALQQGVSMPTNMMLPGAGGMNQQAAAFMTTPMGVATSTGLPQQVMLQTSAGQVLVPASGSVPQMVHGQGVMPNPHTVPMMPQGQVTQHLMHGQDFAPNATLPTQKQQVVYGQGIPQTQAAQAPPLMSTSVTADSVSATLQRYPDNSNTLEDGGAVAKDTVSGCSDVQSTVSSHPDVGDTSKSSAESHQSREGSTGSLVTPARMSSKRRSEDVRALVLGPLEDQFDSLMDQVRDANPSAVLKKVPEDVEDKEREPSYTGMAAALAEALKQRRLHVADKRKSLGDLDESTSTSEWQSP